MKTTGRRKESEKESLHMREVSFEGPVLSLSLFSIISFRRVVFPALVLPSITNSYLQFLNSSKYFNKTSGKFYDWFL